MNHNDMNPHDDSRELCWIKNADNQTRRHHNPARRDDEHEQRHIRHAQPSVLEHKSIQCTTAKEQPGVVEYKSILCAAAREQPGVLGYE